MSLIAIHKSGRSRGLRRAVLVVLAVLILVPTLSAQQIPRFRLKEEKARALFKKGLIFHNARRYVAAREFFYKALNINPSFHLARRYLGDAQYYAGEWNAALEQWEYLDSLSGGAYPLVRQRSEILRFGLNRHRNAGPYVFLSAYTPSTWRGYSFARPTDIAIGEDNHLYILSYRTADILRVNPGGRPVRTFSGPFYDRMKGPVAMAIKKEQLYVCDYDADRVRVLSTTGNSLAAFGETGSAPGKFRGPSGIALYGSAIYVADSGNRRIQKFDLNGRFIASFGRDTRGNRPEIPGALAVGPNGVIYLVDRGARRLLRYDEDGNFLGAIASPKLKRPRGVSVDRDRLVVTDEEAGVFFYDLNKRRWSTLTGLRDKQDRPLLLHRPFSTRLDANGILHLAEYGGHRVMTIVPRGLRFSNMDIKVQRIEADRFPNMAVMLTIRNRLGRSIRGLTRREIILYENDRRVGGIRTDNLNVFRERTNIALIQENSTAIKKHYRRHLASVLQGLLDPLRISDRLKMIRVGAHVRVVYSGLERRRIVNLMSRGVSTGTPNLGKGLHAGITGMLGALGPRAVVLVASGRNFAGAFDQYSLQRIRQYARSNGVAVFVISFEAEQDPRARQDQKQLYQGLARATGGRYYRAFDETALKDIYTDIRRNRDDRYLLTYESKADRRLSGRYVDLRVEVRYLKTHGKGNGGYFVP